MLNTVYILTESLIAFTAVIENFLVIFIFLREKKLQKRTNYFIISLAVADFLTGLVGIPSAVMVSSDQSNLKKVRCNLTHEIFRCRWDYQNITLTHVCLLFRC